MKPHRYVDHQRLHIVTKDVISLSISVLLFFRHYISHKITFGAPSSGGVLRSACGAFIGGAFRVNLKHVIGEECSKNQNSWQNSFTVKTLYNVTRYNRIFNIRHKIAGNGSVSIKIPSL